ncbi:30S ribosomal protein S15 [Candidatus Woesearchaeota archaeon]|nr:30S ribosomal protein S15 [Candidatus Woesearchaeota archaeon]
MARMYSKKKGKSGSKHPVKMANPSWQRYTPKEIELLAIKLVKAGKTPSQIGLYFRDVYGIPDVKLVTGKSVSALLKEKNILPELPEDVRALIKRLLKITSHLELNNHDQTAHRGLTLTRSKLNRLIKYYKHTKRLASDWKLDMTKLRLYIE